MYLHFYGRIMSGWNLLGYLIRPWKWRWLFTPPPGPLRGAPMYIRSNGRIMKAEEAIEMWRKQGMPEHEIKLRNLVVSLLRDGNGRTLSTRRPPPELR